MAAKIAIPLAALALAGVTACGSASPSPRAEALAYMQAHPAQSPAGMTAGIILTLDDVGFARAAATEARCPAVLTASTDAAAGGLPACGAWTATAETASGAVVSLSCGSIRARQECPSWRDAAAYIPMPGDYARFRANGHITTAADCQVITEFAVSGIPAPDADGPVWVTTPAR